MPAGHLHHRTEQVGRLLGFDNEQRFSVVDGGKQRGAVAAGVDANRDGGIASRGFAGAIEPLLDVFDVGFTKRGIAGAQPRAEYGVGDASEDRVVARTAVIARVAARQRSFLVTEERHDRGVDVDGHAFRTALSQHPQAVLGNDRFELLTLVRPEAAQIIVEHIDARHGRAGQVLEQRVVGEPLEVEHPPRVDHRSVNEQLDRVRLHRGGQNP
ncbi:MAG: hypothetical protein ABI548_13120 [Polyangiaceae bacterium]